MPGTETDPFRVTSLWLCQFCARYRNRPLQGHQLTVVSVLCQVQKQTPSGSPAYGCVSFVPGTETDPFRVASLWLCQFCARYRNRPLQGHQLMVVSVLCQVQKQPLQGHQLMVVSVLCQVQKQTPSGSPAYGCVSFVPGTETDPLRVASLWLCQFCARYRNRPLKGRQLMVVSVLCQVQKQTPSGSPAYGCVSFVPGTETDPFRVTSLWLCQFCARYRNRPLKGRQLMVVSVLCQVQTQTATLRSNENSVSLLSAYLGSALQGLGFTQSKHFCYFGTYLLMGVR